jgi:hypothetical protein
MPISTNFERDRASSWIRARVYSDKNGVSFRPDGIDVEHTALDNFVQAGRVKAW